MAKNSLLIIVGIAISTTLLSGCQKGFYTNSTHPGYKLSKEDVVLPPETDVNSKQMTFDEQRALKRMGTFQKAPGTAKSGVNNQIEKSELLIDPVANKVRMKIEVSTGSKIQTIELEGDLEADGTADLVPVKNVNNFSTDFDLRSQLNCLDLTSDLNTDNGICVSSFAHIFLKDTKTNTIERTVIEYIDQKYQAAQTQIEFEAAAGATRTQTPQTGVGATPTTPETSDEEYEDLSQYFKKDTDVSVLEPGDYVGRAPKDPEQLFQESAEGTSPQLPDTTKLPQVPTGKTPENNKNPSKPPKVETPKSKKTPPDGAKSQIEQTKDGRPINQAQGAVALKNASNLLEIQNRLGDSAGFKIINPEKGKYYGTFDLVQSIAIVAKKLKDKMPDKTLRIGNLSRKNGGVVNDPGCSKTGQCSVTHKNGNDVDIEYVLNRENESTKLEAVVQRGKFAKASTHLKNQTRLTETYLSNNFNFQGNWLLLKEFYATGTLSMAFTHDMVKISLCSYALATGEYKGRDDKSSAAYEILRRLQPENRNHYHHVHIAIKCSAHDRNCKDLYKNPPTETDCFKYKVIEDKFSQKNQV